LVISRYAIFVDAGYVFGQGALSFSSGKLTRAQLRLDEAGFINQLKSITTRPAVELLRFYWYDGTRGNMTMEQTTLAEMPDVKMRLGYINGVGQQKGVDSLIVTDLIELARNQAIGDAYLVSGDGDLRVAVQIAQSFGVRVHLITLEPSNSSLNPQLRQEADTRQEIPRTEVLKFLHMAQPQSPVLSTTIPAGKPLVQSVSTVGVGPQTAMPTSATVSQSGLTVESVTKQAIKSVFATVQPDDIARLKTLQTGSAIPAEYDRKILGTSRALLGRDLTASERALMRKLVSDWLSQL
jgi:uncharacterized LabA/DUF88 family protein